MRYRGKRGGGGWGTGLRKWVEVVGREWAGVGKGVGRESEGGGQIVEGGFERVLGIDARGGRGKAWVWWMAGLESSVREGGAG